MTGGWGTPPGKPILESIKETADRLRERSKEQPAGAERLHSILSNVMTGRCSDGLHDDCHGHLLGVPCCCDCHTTTEENTDDR